MNSIALTRSPRPARPSHPAAGYPATAETSVSPAATWTLVAGLCAARQEADGSISLAVSDPTGRPHRLLARIPSPESGLADPRLHLRAVAARRAFIRDLTEPPFEGYTLLYGTARLTLTLSENRRAVPDVVDFTLLDGARPTSPCRQVRSDER
jgi:hypothetical protein